MERINVQVPHGTVRVTHSWGTEPSKPVEVRGLMPADPNPMPRLKLWQRRIT